MFDILIRRLCLLITLFMSCAAAVAQSTEQIVRMVDGQVLTSQSGVTVSLEVSDSFRHVGGQRFILRGHTDVEQHFFVVANSLGNVERMYWVQFEEKLPHNEGPYSYPSTEKTDIDGFDFVAHVRIYDTEPVDDSDRGAAYRYLAGQGYRVPTPAIRSRLVHIPEGDGRQELMIVYLERTDEAGEVSMEDQERLVSRAIAGLSVRQPD